MKQSHCKVRSFFAVCVMLFVRPGAGVYGQGTSRPGPARNSQGFSREIPLPPAGHWGNVFLEPRQVVVPAPQGLPRSAVRWRAVDDAGHLVGAGRLDDRDRVAKLGSIGIGWYRAEFLDAGGKVLDWTTAAVLAPLAEPVPLDSPVCVDSATAWFAPSDTARQELFAQLAALAGVNWIRDRMSWGQMQAGPDRFAGQTTYDSAASLQARYGLKVLQVFHDSPGWAVDKRLDPRNGTRRFTRDLRLLYRFCKAMAQRYKGRVLAWEPWNEANIEVFGGHPIDEMCSHQKAAYLGFKAGDAGVTVCWNVYAGAGTHLHSQGVIENECWPYFETYNIHSYRPPEQYLEQFSTARQAACGRPIWISECGVPLSWKKDGSGKELSRQDELEQARFIAQSYASSIFAGVQRHFFFILGDYAENKIQFGLLRKDQTPRPGYVALAAAGRLLAGAKCLGRWTSRDNPSVRLYAFAARPDGKRCDVLVAWSKQPVKWSLPQGVSVDGVFDYLGRSVGRNVPRELGPAAFYVLLRQGHARKLELEPPPSGSPYRPGQASKLVLQLQMPQAATDLAAQAHKVPADKSSRIEIFAYNFGDVQARGVVQLDRVPDGWQLSPRRWTLEIEPMGRRRLLCDARIAGSKPPPAGWIKLRGDFGGAGRPTLAFRLSAGGTSALQKDR